MFLSQSGNASNKNSFSSSGLAGRTVSVEVSKGGAATVVSRAAFPERKVNKNHIPQNNKREKSKLANKIQNQSCDSVSKRSSLNLFSCQKQTFEFYCEILTRFLFRDPL